MIRNKVLDQKRGYAQNKKNKQNKKNGLRQMFNVRKKDVFCFVFHVS